MNTQPHTDASTLIGIHTAGALDPVFRDEEPTRHPESFIDVSKRRLTWTFMIRVGAVMFGGLVSQAFAATAEDLNKDAGQALTTLYGRNPTAEVIAKKAKAILVFPKVIKAGLVFGGAYGEGVLIRAGKPTEYYNSVSASWGFQAGAESYAYVVLLMNDKAVNYLATSQGWELGVGPTVVVVNEGIAKNLSTSTLKDDAYAFIIDQQGLMASISIEGTKISHIKR